ncbi:MAG: cytochrome C oxidase subunit IV family protein [Myxococcota bacterium]|nr:cytochrome C oxidase subunit IV family protein [Myxococcota bacterium]
MSEEHHTSYVKIWAILVVLLAISVAGPELEILWVTLVTAFGIAFVKAYIVVQKFMHLGHAPKFVTYVMVTCLVFMLLFIAGTASDIYKSNGENWYKIESEWQYMPPVAQHGDDHASGDTETH